MIYSTHLLRHIRSVIGGNVHRVRTARRVSLGKLAALTGLSRELLDQYEIGKNEVSIDHLVKIACALDVTLVTFLSGQPNGAAHLAGGAD